jgi:Tol biopolymer transport system component
MRKWWPDSKSIIVSQDKARNERVTLYRVFIDKPNALEPVTKVDPDYYIRGCSLSPDSKTLYYFANLDKESGNETEIFHLYRQDVETQELLLLTSPENQLIM